LEFTFDLFELLEQAALLCDEQFWNNQRCRERTCDLKLDLFLNFGQHLFIILLLVQRSIFGNVDHCVSGSNMGSRRNSAVVRGAYPPPAGLGMVFRGRRGWLCRYARRALPRRCQDHAGGGPLLRTDFVREGKLRRAQKSRQQRGRRGSLHRLVGLIGLTLTLTFC